MATVPEAFPWSERRKQFSCANCLYFKPNDHSSGYCHRNSPTAVPWLDDTNPANGAYWPIVQLSDWCGDYRYLLQPEYL